MYLSKTLLLSSILLSGSLAAQTAESAWKPVEPQQLNNHHILLVPSSTPGTEEAQWIGVAPTGALEIIPLSQLEKKTAAGYRPFTFGELRETLKTLVSRGEALESQLREAKATPPQVQQPIIVERPSLPNPEAEAAIAQARLQQQQFMKQQAIMMFLTGMHQQQPSTIDLNVRDCSHYPALCVH